MTQKQELLFVRGLSLLHGRLDPSFFRHCIEILASVRQGEEGGVFDELETYRD